MGISYRRPGQLRPRPVAFVRVREPITVRVLGRPESHIFVDLHWIGKYSVPCYGAECELCFVPPICGAYLAVALTHLPPQGKPWESPGILFVTDGARRLAEADMQDKTVLVYREGDKRNGRICFAVGNAIAPPTIQLFEFKDRLENEWSRRERIVSMNEATAKEDRDAELLARAKARLGIAS